MYIGHKPGRRAPKGPYPGCTKAIWFKLYSFSVRLGSRSHQTGLTQHPALAAIILSLVVAAAYAGEQQDKDQPVTAASAVVEQTKAIAEAAATAVAATPRAVAVEEEQQDEDPDPAGDAPIVVRSADVVIIVASAVSSS